MCKKIHILYDLLQFSFQKAESPHWHRDIDSHGRYLCKFCDLKYSTKQTLLQHIKNKHFTQSQVLKHKILKNKRRQRIKCHICHKNFMILSDLKYHFNTLHSTTLDKSCSLCLAVFKNVDEKNEHEIIAHNGIIKYTYLCTICGYRTPKKSCYNDHQNTHSIKKEIKCKYCDYCTNKAVNLKTHERIHTNCKPYKCDFKDCNYSCTAKSGLNSHKLQHYPEENMLYCDKCQYKTVYLQSLKKHQGTHKT